MTHAERLALIHRPFFTTRFSTPYPWGGANTGGYVIADQSGGRQRGAVSTSHEGVERSLQWEFNQEISTLWDAQHALAIGDAAAAREEDDLNAALADAGFTIEDGSAE